MALDFDALVNSVVVATFGMENVGQPIPVYTPQGGAPFDIDGVFDEAWREFDVSGGARGPGFKFSTTKPVFACQLSNFPTGVTPARRDNIAINGATYEVADIRGDGISGWVLLVLN